MPRNTAALPEECVLEFISKRTVDHFVAINKHDTKGRHDIFSHMAQLPLSFKLKGDMISREICNDVADQRHEQCGSRMQTPVADGHVVDGKVYWAEHAGLNAVFTDDTLARIQHKSTGDEVKVDPQEMLVTCAWKPVDVWHDLSAGYQHGKQAHLRLCGLFHQSPAPDGPWTQRQLSGFKSRSWFAFVETCAVRYLDEKNKLLGRDKAIKIKEILHEMHKEEQAELFKRARVAAQAGLARQKHLGKLSQSQSM